jgi:hypothetical protein
MMTDYFLSTSGNDLNDGLSPETAWRETRKFNDLAPSLHPGDRLLMKAGDVWGEGVNVNGSFLTLNSVKGNRNAPVHLSSYSNGPKPLIIRNGKAEGVRVSNSSHFIVGGIGTETCNIGVHSSQNVTITNCVVSDFNTHDWLAGIWFQGNKNCRISENLVRNSNNYSVYDVLGENITVEDNELHGVTGDPAISNIGFEQTKNSLIQRNNCSSQKKFFDPYLNERIVIRDNFAKCGDRGAVSMDGIDDVFFNNYLVWTGALENTWNGIAGNNRGGTLLIANNTFMDFGNSWWNQFNPGWLGYNNILQSSNSVGGTLAGIFEGGNPRSMLKNNCYHRRGNVPNYNIYNSSGWDRNLKFLELQIQGFDEFSFIADPLIQEDYKLATSSPCRGTARSLSSLGVTDFWWNGGVEPEIENIGSSIMETVTPPDPPDPPGEIKIKIHIPAQEIAVQVPAQDIEAIVKVEK